MIFALLMPCKLFSFPYTELPKSSLGKICRQYMENRAPAQIIPQAKLYPYYDEAKKLYGYVDAEDNVVIPAKYETSSDFYTVLCGKNAGKSYAVVQKEYKDPDDLYEDEIYGIIDESGKTVVPFKYYRMNLQYADGGNILIAQGSLKKNKIKFGLHRGGSAGGNGETPLLGFGLYDDDDEHFYIWNMTSGKSILKNQWSCIRGGWTVESPFEPSPFIIIKEDLTFLGAFDADGNLNIYHFINQYENGSKSDCFISASTVRKCLDIPEPKNESNTTVKRTANPNILLVGHAKTEKGEKDLRWNDFKKNNGDIDWTFYDIEKKTEFPIPFKNFKIMEIKNYLGYTSGKFSVISIHGEETK